MSVCVFRMLDSIEQRTAQAASGSNVPEQEMEWWQQEGAAAKPDLSLPDMAQPKRPQKRKSSGPAPSKVAAKRGRVDVPQVPIAGNLRRTTSTTTSIATRSLVAAHTMTTTLTTTTTITTTTGSTALLRRILLQTFCWYRVVVVTMFLLLLTTKRNAQKDDDDDDDEGKKNPSTCWC